MSSRRQEELSERLEQQRIGFGGLNEQMHGLL